MSSGAVTLQCPHCGGVFLTLQQGGIIEICPHCAVGAPRSSFVTSSSPVGALTRTEIPPVKLESGGNGGLAPSPPPVPASPIPFAPEAASIAALHGPSFVQALPTTHEIVPRTQSPPVPAENGLYPATEALTEALPPPEPAATPDAAPALDDEPLSPPPALWPPVSSIPEATELGAVDESAAPPHEPPHWPGLGLAQTPGSPALLPTDADLATSASELGQPRLSQRRIPWFTLTMLGIVVGCVTWLAFQTPPAVHVPKQAPAPRPKVASQPKAGEPVAATPPTAAPPSPVTPPPVATSPVAAPPSPKEPTTEVKAAIHNASPDAIAALRARAEEERLATLAREMVQGLGKAVTQSDRLRWLDTTGEQPAGVKRFFETHRDRLDPEQLKASAGRVTLFPSGRETKLFRLTTKACPEGAIVQAREDGGRTRMHWGLFEQSHEKTYDRFLAKADRREPAQWFTLLCERTHSFELKGAAKDRWTCFVAQGSLGNSGTGQVYVNKESAAGRYLESKTRWGCLYLAELLVGKMEVDGHLLNVVLDCAGMHVGGRRP